MVSVELSWLHDDKREQGCDSSRATPDGAIFAAALVSMKRFGFLLRYELLTL